MLEQDKLLAADGAVDDHFSWCVSLDGDYALIGALYGDNDRGAAYVFIKGNLRQSTPTINGPNNGVPGKTLIFTFYAVDPEGDDVKFHIDWGDGTSNMTYFYPSGVDVSVSHSWTEKGEYTITAYAEDIFGNIGLSTTKQVTIPRNKAINSFPFVLLDRFPVLKEVLLRLMIL